MGFPMGTRTRRRHRQRLAARLLDVPIGTRATSHGDTGPHRWPLADPVVRAEVVRRVRGRFDNGWLTDAAGSGMGAVAGHLLRLEGVQVGKPDRQTGNGDGVLSRVTPDSQPARRPNDYRERRTRSAFRQISRSSQAASPVIESPISLTPMISSRTAKMAVLLRAIHVLRPFRVPAA